MLIHEKFAQRNGLAVGDAMLLGTVSENAHTIPVTVAGGILLAAAVLVSCIPVMRLKPKTILSQME